MRDRLTESVHVGYPNGLLDGSRGEEALPIPLLLSRTESFLFFIKIPNEF